MTRIAAATFDVPMAFVSLIDSDRQWFKARCGLSGESSARNISFCSHALLQSDPLVVPDTQQDQRFFDNPFVTEDPNIRFYAGVPLSTIDGYRIGTFCIADRRPRDLAAEELKLLNDMASAVQDQLNLMDIGRLQTELRIAENELQRSHDELERSNQLIRSVFGRYMTDDVANVILESADSLQLGGELRDVTILMCDVRGFTTFAQHLPPETVVLLLNRFLGRMIDLIIEFGGTVDQILGDGILAIFGAPLELKNPSPAAVACAMEMQKAATLINEENTREGLPRLEAGIGINSGPVVVGNIGSEKRMKYSVIGNAVNLASRIESLCLGGQVLISEAVRNEIGEGLRLDGHLRVKVKGIEGPITIYEVSGIEGEHRRQNLDE